MGDTAYTMTRPLAGGGGGTPLRAFCALCAFGSGLRQTCRSNNVRSITVIRRHAAHSSVEMPGIARRTDAGGLDPSAELTMSDSKWGRLRTFSPTVAIGPVHVPLGTRPTSSHFTAARLSTVLDPSFRKRERTLFVNERDERPLRRMLRIAAISSSSIATTELNFSPSPFERYTGHRHPNTVYRTTEPFGSLSPPPRVCERPSRICKRESAPPLKSRK